MFFWWTWISLGIALLILELFTPTGFILLFIGLGAILTGILVKIGILWSTSIQWFVFAGLSIFFLLFLRKRTMTPDNNKGPGGNTGLVSEKVILLTDLKVNETGQGELHGSNWKVKNCGQKDYTKGEVVSVVKADGITLEIV